MGEGTCVRLDAGIIILGVVVAAGFVIAQLGGRDHGRRTVVTTAAQLGSVPPGQRVRITGVAAALRGLTSAPIGG